MVPPTWGSCQNVGSASVGLGWGLRPLISNQLPENAAAAGGASGNLKYNANNSVGTVDPGGHFHFLWEVLGVLLPETRVLAERTPRAWDCAFMSHRLLSALTPASL